MNDPDHKDTKIRIITTDDGSHSLFVPSLNETYHSFHGAVRESIHVFIEMGLAHRISLAYQPPIRIFEVGLGTGLNAILTAEFSKKNNLPIHFTSIEAFPIDYEVAEQLNYTSFLTNSHAAEWFKKIHHCEWNTQEAIHENFILQKIDAKLEEHLLPENNFDIIYFDAFAPNKQAELWDLGILKTIAEAMKPKGVFVTYCAKGQLKRDLHSLGLKVETLAGPPGKKEMVRASKH